MLPQESPRMLRSEGKESGAEAQVRRRLEGGQRRQQTPGVQEGEHTGRGLRAWPGLGGSWLLPARPPASQCHMRCLDAGCRARAGRDPGSEGTWVEAQVCPTCIPLLGLGISGRRALLRGGTPGPWLISLQGLQGEDGKETAVGATVLNLGGQGRANTGQKRRSPA